MFGNCIKVFYGWIYPPHHHNTAYRLIFVSFECCGQIMGSVHQVISSIWVNDQ